MLQPLVPHFSFPMKYNPVNGTMTAVEQDSLDDIYNCVHATVRTRPGQRQMQPEFGVTDVTFMEQNIDLAEMKADVRRWEPRSTVVWDSRMDDIDSLVVNIRAEVGVAS